MAKDMQSSVFRKKSMERISSPEQLNDYIRVSTPSVWIVLVAIVILLAGVCVWGVLGHLDTTLPAVAVVSDGQAMLYIKEADIADIEAGMTVRIGGEEYTVTAIAAQPVAVDESFSEYARHVGSLQSGEWVFAVSISGSFTDGVYSADIVIESVTPMSFILN